MMKQVARVVQAVCIALLPACGPGEEKAEASSTAAPSVVMLSSANDAFDAPDTIAAGWTSFQFTNKGNDIHYAHIVRLDSGRTVPELVAAYAEAIRTSGPRPKWVTRFGGPGGAAPGGTATVTQFLEPGSYVWICPIEDEQGNPHFGKGEHKPFVVHGAPAQTQVAAPTATSEVRLMDFSFAIDSTLRSGAHTIRVVNAGVEPHDLVLMKLVEGKTIDDIRRWMNPEQARRSDRPAEPPPPLESLGIPAGGIAAIASGYEVFMDLDLTPGDYVAVCMATAPDGRSHIEHGMIQQFRIN
jgi:hypothetical protein